MRRRSFLEGDRATEDQARCPVFPLPGTIQRLRSGKPPADEEIKINRPFAPQIYRRVIPITLGKRWIPLISNGDGYAGRICD